MGIYSLGLGFTIQADKKGFWKLVKQVLDSQELEFLKSHELERFVTLLLFFGEITVNPHVVWLIFILPTRDLKLNTLPTCI